MPLFADVELVWRGFELHPATPRGGRDLSEMFGPRVAGMHDQLRRFSAQMGAPIDKLSTRIPNTRRPLAMAEYARDQGKLDLFRELTMKAWWSEGRDIESDAVLSDLAAATGLDPAEAIAAADGPVYQRRIDATRAEASRIGITGIPTFVAGGYGVVGCQPDAVIAGLLEKAGAKRKAG